MIATSFCTVISLFHPIVKQGKKLSKNINGRSTKLLSQPTWSMTLNKDHFNSIKDIVTRDKVQFFDRINKLVNEILAIFVRDFKKDIGKTLYNFKNSIDYNIFYSGCNSLFRQKIYIDASNTKFFSSFDESSPEIDHSDATKISFNNSNKQKLISYSTLIHFFWDYYNEITDYMISKLIEIEIPILTLHYNTNVVEFFNIWTSAYMHFWAVSNVLFPIINYVYLNYPNVSQKYVSNNDTLHNYFNRKFHDALKNKLNETSISYKDFLQYSIQGLLNAKALDNNYFNVDTPFRFAYLFKETIDGKPLQEYVFKQYKQDTISKHKFLFQNGKIYDDKHHNKEIQTFIQFFSLDLANKVTLVSMFSPTWMEPIKNILVETSMMNKDIISRYYYFFRDNFDFEKNDDYAKDQNGYMGTFRFVYLSRGKTDELDQICSDIIYNEISKLYDASDKLSLIKVFETLFFQIKFFSRIKPVEDKGCTCSEQCVCYSEHGPEYIRKAYIKLFENEMNLIQAILVYVQTMEKLSVEDNINLQFFFSNFGLLLKRLSIPSIITSLYSEHLFRYVLMNYNTLVDSANLDLDSTVQFIRHAITVFNDIYCDKVHNLVSMWRNFEENITKVCANKDRYNELVEFYPLILPQSDIPEIYQRINDESSLNDVRLPTKIREMWRKFEKNYKDVILMNGEHKVMHPLYGLQYCSVETPFLRENGEPLILELTLYQTCVLNEFNKVDQVSFKQLVERLQIDGNNMKAILNSFLNIGLIKMNKDKTFSVNEMFKAEERKIKKDVLRVVMGKRTKKPSRKSNNAKENCAESSFSGQEDETRQENIGRESEDLTSGHHEGPSFVWRREVIKACIVRTVKSHIHNVEGISEKDLMHECLPQLLQGTSVGEFQSALRSAVHERYITRTSNGKFLFDM